MKTQSITCIIPFYNEAQRLAHVLNGLDKIGAISQFVLINDGSTEKMPVWNLPKGRFQVVTNVNNHGKSHAISVGLRYCTNEIVLLFDADITHIDEPAITQAIAHFSSDHSIDHIIFQRHNPSLITRINRIDTVFSGERLLKKSDLEKTLKYARPQHYQLESAINHYMITHRKNSYFIPTSHQNLSKSRKRGRLKGQFQNIKMFTNVLNYNPASYFYQLLFFCRTTLHHHH